MPRISPLLRRQIDTAAYELIAVAEKLRPISPALADVYRAIGQGLESSHYNFQGGHNLHFDLPADCHIEISTPEYHEFDGPAKLSFRAKAVKQ